MGDDFMYVLCKENEQPYLDRFSYQVTLHCETLYGTIETDSYTITSPSKLSVEEVKQKAFLFFFKNFVYENDLKSTESHYTLMIHALYKPDTIV